MASTFSSALNLELQASGENSGTWGVITNNNLQKVEAKLEPDCDMDAEPVTDSSPTLAAKDEPDINGDPTFWTPPPLTEATANSAIDPCPSGIMVYPVLSF